MNRVKICVLKSHLFKKLLSNFLVLCVFINLLPQVSSVIHAHRKMTSTAWIQISLQHYQHLKCAKALWAFVIPASSMVELFVAALVINCSLILSPSKGVTLACNAVFAKNRNVIAYQPVTHAFDAAAQIRIRHAAKILVSIWKVYARWVKSSKWVAIWM